jgi:hypothetical protein
VLLLLTCCTCSCAPVAARWSTGVCQNSSHISDGWPVTCSDLLGGWPGKPSRRGSHPMTAAALCTKGNDRHLLLCWSELLFITTVQPCSLMMKPAVLSNGHRGQCPAVDHYQTIQHSSVTGLQGKLAI